MNQALAEMVGGRVKLWQVGSENYYYTEEGVLESYDHPWLAIRSDKGELACFPVYTIRMVRPASQRGPSED